jgi:hypothetical protein
MVNVSTLADGRVDSISRAELVQKSERLINCADLNTGYKVSPGLTKLTAGVVYAISKIPANSILINGSFKTVKAEGGAATITFTIRKQSDFTNLITLTAALNGNSVGDADYWQQAAGGSTDGYIAVDSYLCMSSDADLDLAKIHALVNYNKSDFSIVNE